MIITRTNPLTGKVLSKEIDCTLDQLKRWQDGEFIQNAMPHLSADDREFIKTGITHEQWDSMFTIDFRIPVRHFIYPLK